MPFLDAHATTLLVIFAVLAVTLGLAAHLLAIRLLLVRDQPANDEVYRRSFRVRPRWMPPRASAFSWRPEPAPPGFPS